MRLLILLGVPAVLVLVAIYFVYTALSSGNLISF